jgi:hypothetical protein
VSSPLSTLSTPASSSPVPTTPTSVSGRPVRPRNSVSLTSGSRSGRNTATGLGTSGELWRMWRRSSGAFASLRCPSLHSMALLPSRKSWVVPELEKAALTSSLSFPSFHFLPLPQRSLHAQADSPSHQAQARDARRPPNQGAEPYRPRAQGRRPGVAQTRSGEEVGDLEGRAVSVVSNASLLSFLCFVRAERAVCCCFVLWEAKKTVDLSRKLRRLGEFGSGAATSLCISYGAPYVSDGPSFVRFSCPASPLRQGGW